jgi:hypothetical protein
MVQVLVRTGPIRILKVEEAEAVWYEVHDGERLIAAWWDPRIAFDYCRAFLRRRRAEEPNATTLDLRADPARPLSGA